MSETSELPGAPPPGPPPGALRQAPGPHADLRSAYFARYALTFLAPHFKKRSVGPVTSSKMRINHFQFGLYMYYFALQNVLYKHVDIALTSLFVWVWGCVGVCKYMCTAKQGPTCGHTQYK